MRLDDLRVGEVAAGAFQRHGVESGRASIITNIEPVVETLVGVTVFHEALTIWTVLGIGCVIGCVALLAKGDQPCKDVKSSTAST